MKNLILLFTILISGFAIGQSYSYKKKQIAQPGSMYFYWGYNRSVYSKSDINFTGDYYNFTIHKAVARDRPETDFKTYIDPAKLTIPQFNFRIGYYLNKDWDLSLGWDHMKYVMQDGQEAKLTGQIPESENQYLNGEFNGEYYVINDEMIHYENTNGLNYMRAQLTYNKVLYQTNNRKFAIRARVGFAAGAVMTQTDFDWNAKTYHTNQKITGFGFSGHTGARFEFFNRFFAQNNFSTGFIALPHLQTIAGTNNYARQKFVYGEWQIVAGAFWYLKYKNGCGSCPDWH